MPTKSDATVSFAKDIKPLLRPIDIQHMKPLGVLLDDYAYMSDATDNHANAQGGLRSAIFPVDAPGRSVLDNSSVGTVHQLDDGRLSTLRRLPQESLRCNECF
jgi:hypothetical protein